MLVFAKIFWYRYDLSFRDPEYGIRRPLFEGNMRAEIRTDVELHPEISVLSECLLVFRHF